MPARYTAPLILFQVCSPNVQEGLEVIQMIFPLIFGRHSVTLLTPLFLKLTHPPIPPEIIVFLLVIVQVKRFKSGYHGVIDPWDTCDVSRPHPRCRIFFASYPPRFPSAGETWCELLPARANNWLFAY